MSTFGYRESDLRALPALLDYVTWTARDKDVSKLVPPKRIRSHWVKRRWARLSRDAGYVLTRLGQRELNAFVKRVRSG